MFWLEFGSFTNHGWVISLMSDWNSANTINSSALENFFMLLYVYVE